MDVVLDLLFTSGIGLLSLFTILFIIGMGFYLSAWMKRKMNDPEE
ncbi:MAG: hypothetical protein B7Y26_10945 [Hydrogenophilales bacterium 16-64-46]|nr:MAG: hypothetical protein B7Z32_11625 [Hydrogenophilales bacterium 12-64-13]OYZ04675.1 MAG: hypothetical protein B7Y26_10945 [Hydrogenophilales bacterium 16-64-46]OZA38361.1 MAG: hypothetical protein B7X87_07660 [Hydrogenophilales bacterium 17-64-34]HQS99717.1 DUF3149 domain-containing protein [Thiobacillus sp.]